MRCTRILQNAVPTELIKMSQHPGINSPTYLPTTFRAFQTRTNITIRPVTSWAVLQRMNNHIDSWISTVSNSSPPPSSPVCDDHKSQISDILESEWPESSMQESPSSSVDFSKEVEQCYSVCLFSFLCHDILISSRCPGT